jgi:hypothetical protein
MKQTAEAYRESGNFLQLIDWMEEVDECKQGVIWGEKR